VLRVDTFGNLITNLTIEHVPLESVEAEAVKLSVGGKEIRKLVQTFALGAPGEPIAIFGSTGFLEIAVNRGNAARALGANRGAEVTLDLS
jgi:S-adenosylmethionine hydrolase